MTISMYQASAPWLAHMLENLSHILGKAQEYADEKDIDVGMLMASALAPDMFPLAKQVQIACDKSRSVVARLADVEVPFYPDDEQSLAELQLRIARSIEFLRSIPAARLDRTEDKLVELPVAGEPTRYTGLELLLGHSIPNVFFHITTAYNILRHNGVPVGKRDFLGDPQRVRAAG